MNRPRIGTVSDLSLTCGAVKPRARSALNAKRSPDVKGGTNQQALASLSWLSYSRPSDFPTVPEPVTARSHASPRCELPTLARLSEPDGTLTRIARCKSRYGPNPLDGICTHFDDHDLAERKNASL
jgi:hypothetical protein